MLKKTSLEKIYINKKIETDEEGYLKNNQDWNITLAEKIAKKENIKLSTDHWKIIVFVRQFYLKFKTTPSMRMLISSLKNNIHKKNRNSVYLFNLFPKGPAKQASKIAGIPKPVKCL
ncbi:MAG: TusE/DsrC/DsvC family sulfur relay protein [Buchnera aphidicola (Pentalonia nigronervosa)]|jgi:tRNA 2-thiouridine synthesizing protein E|uniref:Sulfurtransferase n=1 Tax=Buchnera aphidicola (Pentalonia nigronervosa) TaxID=1309793 RepID=A0A7H1AYU6_9GAMM|nr:MAG: TusE/DsrC/DsvC family sulfur relay protein [Buchnera aphidicola (Pentalonia nigronervosa)]